VNIAAQDALQRFNVSTLQRATMKYVDLTLPTPAENLACDEALLDWCEEGFPYEILRFWEPHEYFVVVGYANRVGTEVNLKACAARQIPVLRRCSGGGTVVQGPGCLNYSLILRIGETGPLSSISDANKFILERHCAALAPLLGRSVERQGCTDLAIRGIKFSGNAQRRKKKFLLFHGTFLLQFDLTLIEELLPLPSRQPDYRRNRAHREFLMDLELPGENVKLALQNAWDASESLADLPHEKINGLARERYNSDAWSFRFP
jgi:lipoate-protein ligase A